MRNLRLDDHNASAQVLAPANNIHNPQNFAVYDTHDSMCSYVNTEMDAHLSGSSNTHSVPMEPVDSRKRQVKMFSSKPLQGGCCDMRCDNDAHYPLVN